MSSVKTRSPSPTRLAAILFAGLIVIGITLYVNRLSASWVPQADAKVREAQKQAAERVAAQVEANAVSHPDDSPAQMAYARMLVDRNEFVRALEPAERAVSASPQSADAHLLLAMIYTTLDYRQDAIAHYKRAIALNPGMLDAYQKLGDYLEMVGDLPGAMDVYRRAAAVAPDSEGPKLSLARNQLSQKHATQALETLSPLLGQSKPPVAALYVAADASKAINKTDDAARYLRTAVQLQPGFAEAWHSLGSILSNESHFGEGIPALQKAVQLVPQNGTYHYALANAIRSDKSRPNGTQEARSEFEKSIELNPGFPTAHYYYGTTLEELGQPDAAAREYRRCLELDARFGSARYRLGVVLRSQGKVEEAKSFLRGFEQQAKSEITKVHGGRRDNSFVDTAEAHYQRGMAMLNKRDKNGAIAEFRTALERDSSYGLARRQLRSMGEAAQ